MKIATIRRRLLSLHKAQQHLFGATVKGMLREYAKIPEARTFLDSVEAVSKLLGQQSKGVESVFAFASKLPAGEGNRSCELFGTGSECGQGCYDYLTAKRKLVEALGDLDEWSPALFLVSEITEKAKPLRETAPEKWNAVVELGWFLASTQRQIVSLTRQVEAITSTQEAILRSFGLQFWADRKRNLRFEGDAQDSA